jgi:hypothetical protein
MASIVDRNAILTDIDVQMIEVGGQQLQVAIKRGPKGRPPLLMFNGIGANWELAKPFLTALKQTEAIIFDIPGVGGSPLPSLPYRPSTLARRFTPGGFFFESSCGGTTNKRAICFNGPLPPDGSVARHGTRRLSLRSSPSGRRAPAKGERSTRLRLFPGLYRSSHFFDARLRIRRRKLSGPVPPGSGLHGTRHPPNKPQRRGRALGLSDR